MSTATPAPGGGDGECEDGHDATTGAVCVDDEGDGGDAMCEGDDEGDDDGDHECVDGIDPATGAECDGGPAANPTDGAEAGGAETGAEDESYAESAVAEHNLPESIGCEGEDDDEEDD